MRAPMTTETLTAITVLACGGVNGIIVGAIARNGCIGLATGLAFAGFTGFVLRFLQVMPRTDEYPQAPEGAA